MLRLATLATVSLVFLAPTFGQAHDEFSVNGWTLLGWCKPEKTERVYELIETRCHGFISGAVKGNQGKLTIGGVEACPDHHVSTAEVRDILVNWIEKRPGSWQENAQDLVGRALTEAFPCNR